MLPSTGHIYLHRLWAFAIELAESSLSETLHLVHCEECQSNLYTCIQANSFGEALRILNRPDDTHHVA